MFRATLGERMDMQFWQSAIYAFLDHSPCKLEQYLTIILAVDDENGTFHTDKNSHQRDFDETSKIFSIVSTPNTQLT
jgi:hypothetical protein